MATQPVGDKIPLPPQPDDIDVAALTPLSHEVILRQATINIGARQRPGRAALCALRNRANAQISAIGTIGHVAHGKSTVVKAISGVQTVRFKNELERNITIKLGYANAKVGRHNYL